MRGIHEKTVLEATVFEPQGERVVPVVLVFMPVFKHGLLDLSK